MTVARQTDAGMRATAGLVLVAAIALAGLVLCMVAEAQGGPAWLWQTDALVSGAALWLYTVKVYQRQRRIAAQVAARDRDDDQAAGVLSEALDLLRAGDVVASAEYADSLPPELATPFINASHALDLLAQQIQASSLEIATAANAVNQIASELASGSSQQAASVIEITAAMEELARTASQIAENAAAQADLTHKAEESGNHGAVAVDEALSGVAEVKKRIGGIGDRADSLGSRSREIYRVLDLITEIAHETHMLSLNAAIEAAAAGQHNRRFSAVAEEVRRLAQRSHESVESVRNLLEEFAESIRATVVATDEGNVEALQVLERARSAALAIDELRGVSGDNARVAREISLATQQQNAASDEVVLTLKEVSQVVQRMADSLRHFSDTADSLNRLGLNIQMLAQAFHLDSPHSLKHMTEKWAALVSRRLGSWESIERLLNELITTQPYVECLYFFDASLGQCALTVNRTLLGERDVPPAVKAGHGFAERPWYRAAVSEGRTILTPLFPSLLSGQPIFTTAAPIYDGDRLAGVLGLDVNADSWTKI